MSTDAPALIPSAKLADGPARTGWREGTLTRAGELEALACWANGVAEPRAERVGVAIRARLDAARQAALGAPLDPRRRVWMFRRASRIERATGNLDAAEALLLNVARPEYVLGQLPSLLNDVQRHLVPTDPRRRTLECIAKRVGIPEPDGAVDDLPDAVRIVEAERGKIVTAFRGARSAALRERSRVRSFSHVLSATIFGLTVLALLVAFLGYRDPEAFPLCFAPEQGGEAVVVCPTGHSDPVPTASSSGAWLDAAIHDAARPHDVYLVELLGLAAAAVAAAVAIRGIRGSSEAVHLPVLLALLKLPTGAITALLGLLLLRGQFVPGLSALDTPAQILGWALLFGYGQQLFTRFVDQQGHNVLDAVRGADRVNSAAKAR